MGYSPAVPSLPLGAGRCLPYELVRRGGQRTLRLSLTSEGGVRVSAPPSASLRAIQVFVRERLGWIDRQRARWERETRLVPLVAPGERVPLLGGSVRLPQAPEGWLRARARGHFGERLAELAPSMGLPPPPFSVRGQRARWGSCSSGGRLSLNWKLLFATPEVVDYVLIHELAHLREANHSARFWARVARRCPGYRRHRAWLRQHAYLLRA